jgi:hypothetical protein
VIAQLVQWLSHSVHSVICETNTPCCVAICHANNVDGAEAQPPAAVRGGKLCIGLVEQYEEDGIRMPGLMHGYF